VADRITLVTGKTGTFGPAGWITFAEIPA